MYPYHNKIKQRIKNGELIGFEFAQEWPKIGSCLVLRFNTQPFLKPIRPHRYAEYAPILSEWAQKQFGAEPAEEKKGRPLSEVEPGEVFKVGEYEFVALEHCAGQTAAILKKPAFFAKFGSSNNYDGSDADKLCTDFWENLCGIVGKENLVEHEVDLTSNDGLDDYGSVPRCVSLLSAAQYRKWVKILDLHKSDSWWWLATADSTAAHNNDRWVLCVSPLGGVDYVNYFRGNGGVRPFCIFKSYIFVS